MHDDKPRIEPATTGHSERAINLFRTLGRNRGLYKPFLSLLTHLMNDGVLPARDREIIVLRVGYNCGSSYEFGQHIPIGLDAGLTEDEVAALATPAGLIGDRDSILVATADDLCRDDMVSDDSWSQLSTMGWSDEQLIEILMLAGFYRMVSGFLNTVRVEPDSDDITWPKSNVAAGERGRE